MKGKITHKSKGKMLFYTFFSVLNLNFYLKATNFCAVRRVYCLNFTQLSIFNLKKIAEKGQGMSTTRVKCFQKNEKS